ncbi:hypothetical protein GX411_00495 [Candidatus Fermentibacteria bacterium]|nr:hypothetical protein [Candidatus Fermentibacteria bacterium]
MRKLLTAVSLALLASCGDSPGGPGTPADYMPVALGNHWEYDCTGFGTFADTIDVELEGSMDIEITDTLRHDSGFPLFQVEIEQILVFYADSSPIDTIPLLETQYWREESGQVSIYESPGDSTGEIIHSPPIEPGRIWYPGPDDPGGVYEVLSTDYTASVPFGNFADCAQIAYTNPEELLEQTDALAPGVGHVMRSGSMTDSLMSIQFELVLTDTNL